MTDDETRRRARRQQVDRLAADLRALWGEVASVFGESSDQMRVLHSAMGSCDVDQMQGALASLRAQVTRPAQVNELIRRLQQCEKVALRRFGSGSAQVSRIQQARRRSDLDEMREIADELRRSLPAPQDSSGPLRPEDIAPAGPESFAPPVTRPPLPRPHRQPKPRAPRRATTKPGPPEPPSSSGVRRRCSCGNELAMASDYVCYQCKPR